MTAAGELALWAAALIALWGAAAGRIATSGAAPRAAAFSESAGRSLWAVALLLAVAVCGLAAAFLAPDLSLRLVAFSTSLNLPRVWRLGAVLSRPVGALLVTAFLAALLGAFAHRAASRAGDVRATALAARLCELLAVSLVAIAIAGDPYARIPRALADGLGLDPAWQIAVTPLARLALVIAGAVFAVALGQTLARRASRAWWLAFSGLGAVALTAALRRSLTGPAWGALEWAVLAAWLGATLWVHARRGPARFAAHLSHAGAALAIVALAGLFMRAEHRAALVAGGTAEFRDPVGATWRFTSEGLSSYDALNRHVRAVLFDVRRGTARTHVVRAEWRRYVDAGGDPLGDAERVDAVLDSPHTSVVTGLASPPAGDDAVLVVKFVPFFVWWWAAAALMVASAAAGIRREVRG